MRVESINKAIVTLILAILSFSELKTQELYTDISYISDTIKLKSKFTHLQLWFKRDMVSFGIEKILDMAYDSNPNITNIILNCNYCIDSLPSSISKFKGLVHLTFNNINFNVPPEALDNLSNLSLLQASSCSGFDENKFLRKMPQDCLSTIVFFEMEITKISDVYCQFPNLRYLSIESFNPQYCFDVPDCLLFHPYLYNFAIVRINLYRERRCQVRHCQRK